MRSEEPTMSPASLSLVVAADGPGVWRVAALGPVDVGTADQLRDELLALLPAGASVLELDVTQVCRCDIAGARALLDVRDAARRAGGGLMLTAAEAGATTLLDTLHWCRLLDRPGAAP
jgi:ABC-type transporter Mla MlaB component